MGDIVRLQVKKVDAVQEPDGLRLLRRGRRRPRAATPQLTFDFEPPSDRSGKLTPITRARAWAKDPSRNTPETSVGAPNAELLAELAGRTLPDASQDIPADAWFLLGCELEDSDPATARQAYTRALQADPRHADARINLGRLLHADGELTAAEASYREALAGRPGDATASFNLGVALEDLGRREEAIDAYQATLASDERYADAHFNIARLLEETGKHSAALRHLSAYRTLTRER